MENPDYKDILEKALIGYAYNKVIFDENGDPADYVFLEVNKAFEKITGLKASDILNKKASSVLPDSVNKEFEQKSSYKKIVLKGGSNEFENYSKPLNQWFKAQIYSDKKNYFTTIFSDITPEKQKDLDYKALLHSIPNLMFIIDKNGHFIDYKAESHKSLFVSPEKFLNKHFSKVLPGEIADLIDYYLNRTLKTGETQQYEYKIEICGKTGYYDCKMSLFSEDKVIAIVRDITYNKKVEENLLKSNENLFITLNSIGDGVISTDNKGFIVLMNPVAEKLCGCTLEEARGKPLTDVFKIINSETRKTIRNPVDKVLENGETVGLANHTSLISSNNKEYQIADSAAPMKNADGDITGVVLVFADISKEYALQQKIREREHRYSSLFNSTIDGLSLNEIVYKDGKPADYIIIDVNPEFEKQNNITKDNIVGNFASSIYDKDPPMFIDIFAEIAETGSSKSFETYLPKSKKHYFVSVFSPEKGKFATIFKDITKRKNAESALENERNQLLSILQSIEEPIYVSDIKTYEILFVNPSLEKILNKDPVGGLCYKEFQGLDEPCWFCTNEIILKQRPYKHHWEHYNPLLKKTFKLHDSIIRWPDGRDVRLELAVDITEQKQTEKVLRESEKRARLQRSEIVKLIFDKAIVNGKLDDALKKITKTLSYAIGAVRTSIWTISDDGKVLECLSLFDAKEKKHGKKNTLKVNEIPSYFEAILKESLISAENAQTDPRTCELADSYLIPYGITSMLDAGILIDGSLIGVVCIEHTGNPRKWHPDEEAFANTAASIVAQLFANIKRKEAETALSKSEEKYRLIFENAPLGVLHFNEKGIVTECNDQLVSIIGSSREALIGLDMTRLPDKRVVNSVKKVLNGKPASFEGNYSSVTADKTTPVRVLFSPVINNYETAEGGIVIIEERSYYIAKEKLEKQVAVAKESAKFKQNFLANMSHEIRTPLTGIMGLIEIIQKSDISPELQEYVKILKNSGENLTEIIDQVLDFSKIEAGKIKLNTRVFKFDSLLKNAQVLFDSMCYSKDLKFLTITDEKLPEFIKADDTRLSQIINNLLSNAVKFTQQGSVTLKASLIMKDNHTDDVIIKIEVIDTGIGIPPEMQEKLFTPFGQIDKQDIRTYEGTGLGLSICKELAELHGGKIGVKSKHKEGSTFWFTFIAQKVATTNQKIENQISDKPSGLKILFVEDKSVTRKVVKIMLSKMGHKVTLAEDGKQAIEAYQPGKFDVILMDIQMPVMDGITATKILKNEHKDLPPIIGLSANAFEGDREKYLAKGFDEYLTKPLKEKDFNTVLEKFNLF